MARKVKLNIELDEIPGLLRSVSSRLPHIILVRRFSIVARGLIVVVFALGVFLVLNIVLAEPDPLSDIGVQVRPLDVETLERVLVQLDARGDELPRTIIGNRREFLVGP